MYKVMLFEDEPPILHMIRDMINSGNQGFVVSDYAFNGRDALIKLKENTPDVIITDIKMPFIDGLELIAKVNELYPDVLCVILSGYSDFEYARSAIRLNVFDYLLKPIQPDDLNNLLAKIYCAFDKNISKMEYDYLCSVVNFQHAEKTYKFEMGFQWYFVILAYAGPLSNQLYEFISPGRDFWNDTDLHPFDEYVKDGGAKLWRFNGKYPNEKIFIVAGDNGNDSWIKNICSRLMELLRNESIPVNIISGHAAKQPADLTAVMKRLMGVLSREVIFAQSNLFFEEEKRTNAIFITQEVEKRFAVLLQMNSFESFRKSFKTLLDEWKERGYPQIVVQTMLNFLVNLFQRTFNARGNEVEFYEIIVNEVISNSINYQSLYENFCSIFKSFYDLRSGRGTSSFSAKELVDKIESYINENYTRNITYKVFYDLFGYNETYITNVFRKIKGISPSKYATKLRIERAKEIIARQPDALLKNVSEMVGYEDPLYFSRVFKDFTGFSPSEYAKNYKAVLM